MRTLLLFLMLITSSAASGLAFGQGQVTDHVKPQAWFLSAPDNSPSYVNICAEAPTAAEASEMAWLAHWSYHAWIRYYYRSVPPNSPLRADPGLASYPHVLEKCDGTEDLTIYYGVENDRVHAARTGYENAAAFAHLESYDDQTGRGKGFIWIDHSPEIQFHSRHRTAILLHEIGHVFGNEHIPGTIMDENIAGILKDAYHSGKPFTPEGPKMENGEPISEAWIDLRREAVEWSVIRLPKEVETIIPGSEREHALFLLTGTHLHGQFDVRFYDKWNWKDETDNYTSTGKGIFVVMGDSCLNPNILFDGIFRAPCVWQFKIVYGPKMNLPAGDQQLFRRVLRGKVYSLPLLSSMQTGYFLDSHGKKTDFVISRNVGEKLDLSIVLGGEKVRVY